MAGLDDRAAALHAEEPSRCASSAVKAFLAYAAQEDITLVALSQAARALKTPAQPRKPVDYLTTPETRAILAAHTGNTPKSRRNRMLAHPALRHRRARSRRSPASPSATHLSLTEPGHLTLTGKGNKTRVVPLTGVPCSLWVQTGHEGRHRETRR